MRLLIADDHDLVRDALRSHIERFSPDTQVVGAGSVAEATKVLETAPGADLVLLDLRMPGMNGLNGLIRLRERFPAVKLALMSGEARPEDIRLALAHGAIGFLPKTLSGDALVHAVRRMAAGESFVPAEMAADTTDVPEGAQAAGFTRREREVLDFLLKGQSNKEIARALDLEEVTVKLHIRGLCRKLGAKNRTQAAMRAVELGLAK
ncbi:response regulator transcription factor [Aerophototrophica crusticola]|uniref:Response regulator transcription factor n=1 Tax=Aerophototrophica crusticola TaxID=1709002 RepID=A0A858RAM6_9PROT|nr:response regulator transcription factor [Rhodospirillaceae bacterium B3]